MTLNCYVGPMRRHMSQIPIKVIMAVAMSLLLPALGTHAQEVSFPERPDVKQANWYVDQANMIAEAERTEINGVASKLMADEQIPLIVVTIPSLMEYNAAHYTHERYAAALFDEWGIGSQRRNYGILLLVSQGDRMARIEFGQAWAHAHDEEAKQIMATLIIPLFRRGQFSEGILAGVRGLDSVARGLALPRAKAHWWVLPLFILGLCLVIGVIINLFRTGRKGWGWALIAALCVMLFFMLRSAASGGGGAFGGGSSGGGGASGSW
jgi:uncharacterized protein